MRKKIMQCMQLREDVMLKFGIAGPSTEESLKYIRRALKSEEMDHLEGTHFDRHIPHVFVTLGASVSL